MKVWTISGYGHRGIHWIGYELKYSRDEASMATGDLRYLREALIQPQPNLGH
jgi:hypothetical protein